MEDRPRDHHFIPVFYLKRWTGEDGKLFAYSKPRPDKVHRKHVGPKAVGYQRDLYSFPDLPENVAQYLESVFLQKTDSMAARVLESIETTGTNQEWTTQTRSAWSRFVINFLIRHPDPFGELRDAVRDRWLQPDSVTQDKYQELKKPEDPPTFQEYVLAQEGLADQIRIKLIQGAMDNVGVGTRLNSLVWNVLDVSKADFKLLTSDWPLDHGLRRNGGHIALPVSPTKLFVAAHDRNLMRQFQKLKPTEMVRKINMLVVSQARRHVFASDDSQDLFIRRRMSTQKRTTPFFPSIAPADPAAYMPPLK